MQDTREIIADVEENDIVKLTYDYEGKAYTFEKVDGTWYYADDHSLNIIQQSVNDMLSPVMLLKAEQVIVNVTDMTQYGLAESSRTIHYETESASYIFQVGDYNAVSDVYYICKPSANTVYAVASTAVGGFEKSLDDLVEESEEGAAETVEEIVE